MWCRVRESRCSAAIVLAGAALLVSVAGFAAVATPDGRAGCSEQVDERLFFGLGTKDGVVTDGAWSAFLAGVVTPRFPTGLTVVDAYGQWATDEASRVSSEPTRVLEIAHDGTSGSQRRVDEIVAIYQHRFGQESVMRARSRVEVCF